ncbi:hypothetical protein DFP91_4672 [Pseudorhodoplanes sinuspersici]|nr:hypothetical protein DFP91_4672 [Pseudorhodoplanes sinuspersici]
MCVGLSCVLALAGCAGHYLMQRDPWRKEAELACLKSGAVKESGTIVRIEPINGPGMCGADFPMKVAALGDSPMLSYSGDLRPPGDVPNAGSSNGGAQRWPVTNEPRYTPPPSPQQVYPGEQQYSNPMRPAPVQRQPLSSNAGAPMPITPPSGGGIYDRAGPPDAQSDHTRSGSASLQDDYMRAGSPDAQPDYGRVPSTGSRRSSVYDAPPPLDHEPVRTRRATASAMPRQPAQPPFRGMPSQASAPMSVPLGGAVAAVGPVEIKPAATLACPIVSALDRWILDSVQPAAQRWFRQPVTEIRQISAYSCRGMNGQRGARISEHAFGNALDIASFVLADGRRITVKNGWKGSPEEQGFLRDVQGAACDQFNTVLAPGSNRFHYDHIHVDLMRRASGHKICNPDQIPGDVVAARVAKERGYAWRPDPGVTGSVGKTRRASLNGGPKKKSKVRNILSADDDDWIEDDGPRPAH